MFLIYTRLTKLVKDSLKLGLFSILVSGCCLLPPADRSICCVRETNAGYDQFALYECLDFDLPNEPLTLEQITEIALKRNLDLAVKAYEYQIQREVLTGERMKMLPNLIMDIQGNDRDRNTGSSSVSLDPLIPPAPPSISLDRSITQYNFNFIYNFLDFGMAYFKSRTETANTWVKAFEYERLRQNMILDVNKQYWKAVVSKRAYEMGKVILEKSQKEIAIYQEQKLLRTLPMILLWRAQDRLLRVQKQVFFYEKQYHGALYALALLMGLPACHEFELAEPQLYALPKLGNPCCYIDIALQSRPELFGADLQESAAVDEARSAILQMFPSLEGTLGVNYNSNSFLIFNHWSALAWRSVWNLLAIPRHLSERDLACWRRGMAAQSRIAITAGVMSQVVLAMVIYRDSLEELQVASQINDTNVELYNTAANEYEVGKIGHPDLLEFESQAYQAEVDALQTYGDARVNLEQINNSLGIPFYFLPNCETIVIPTHKVDVEQLRLNRDQKYAGDKNETDEH